MKYKDVLEDNFLKLYPQGTFRINPFFADRTIGECETVDQYLQKIRWRIMEEILVQPCFSLIHLDIKV